MATSAHTTPTWRFGVFEVDAQTGELRRAGMPVKLREQCFRILVLLLEHEGQLVTREDLRKALWSSETFVDFDHSLNAAVMKLREALGDTAEKPLYIETIPKRGYRFIAPVVHIQDVPNEAHLACDTEVDGRHEKEAKGTAHEAEVKKSDRSLVRSRRWVIVSAVIALVLLAATVWNLRQQPVPLRIPDYIQLTSDGRIKTIEGTDGNNIYLNLWSPAGHATVPVTGGTLREFPIDLSAVKASPNDNPILLGVSPDGSEILVRNGYVLGGKLWAVGTQGVTARFLADQSDSAAWSPDGKTVAYSNWRGDIYAVPSQGGESRLVLGSATQNGNDQGAEDLAWSPDGTRIRFVGHDRYWEVPSAGTNAHEILPHWHAADPKYLMWSGHWTPDGDYFLFAAASAVHSQDLAARSQIWAVADRYKRLRRRHPEPVQLTTGATIWAGMDGFYMGSSIASQGNFAISRDGSKVYATGSTVRGELVHGASSGKLQPYFGGISAEFVDFSKDGNYVLYVTYPEGLMWRANRNGSGLMELNTRPLYPVNPRWSPDATQIVFVAQSAPFSSGPAAMYTIPSQGGTPKRLLPGDTGDEGDPNWSPDGKRIVFSHGFGSVRILNLDTGRMTDLPPVPGLYSPRWSRDGRYIAALVNLPNRDLAVYKVETNRWSMLHLDPRRFWCNWPTWSHDASSTS